MPEVYFIKLTRSDSSSQIDIFKCRSAVQEGDWLQYELIDGSRGYAMPGTWVRTVDEMEIAELTQQSKNQSNSYRPNLLGRRIA